MYRFVGWVHSGVIFQAALWEMTGHLSFMKAWLFSSVKLSVGSMGEFLLSFLSDLILTILLKTGAHWKSTTLSPLNLPSFPPSFRPTILPRHLFAFRGTSVWFNPRVTQPLQWIAPHKYQCNIRPPPPPEGQTHQTTLHYTTHQQVITRDRVVK